MAYLENLFPSILHDDIIEMDSIMVILRELSSQVPDNDESYNKKESGCQ